jgi:hypothetical protein
VHCNADDNGTVDRTDEGRLGMTTDLFELVRAEAAELAEVLARELRTAGTPHYLRAAPDVVRRRCHRLVKAFLESTRGHPAPFVKYVRQITDERIAEGYYLAEMQQALRLLEERVWRIAVEGSSIDRLVRHLGIVTGTIGAAKDELARAFLSEKQRAEAETARLRAEHLFKGTEGHVEPAPALQEH